MDLIEHELGSFQSKFRGKGTSRFIGHLVTCE